MRLRLFISRLRTTLLRGSWQLRALVTAVLLGLILAGWWFFCQKKLINLQSQLVLQVSELHDKQQVFQEVLIEYQKLRKQGSRGSSREFTEATRLQICHAIIMQAHWAGLALKSYTNSGSSGKHEHLTFVLIGDYASLVMFLQNMKNANLGISCERLKIVQDGCRLQITYVCGIHTVVKSIDFE